MKNNKLFQLAIIINSVYFLVACSSIDSLILRDGEGSKHKLYTTSPSAQIVITRTIKGKNILCLGPTPDATFNQSESGSVAILNFGLNKDGEKLSEGSSEGALGGRSPNVLITREILYRYCELMGNVELTSQQSIDLYIKILDTLKQINAIDLGAGTQDQTNANVRLESNSK